MSTSMMKYLCLFSGISALTVAWQGLNTQALAYAEIDPFASAVLAHHYPQTPNLGDVTRVDWTRWQNMPDVVFGGSPCQSFSSAGNRESLSDDRGNLALKFAEICNVTNPVFTVWENVPGVLRTKDNAFGSMLGKLVGATEPLTPPASGKWDSAGFCVGPRRSVAWRVLCASNFGVPQRRRRVFVVAFDPRASLRIFSNKSEQELRGLAGIPGAILFEPEGVRRSSQEIKEGRAQTTTPTRSSAVESSYLAFTSNDFGQDAGTLSPTLRAIGGPAAIAYNIKVAHMDRKDGGLAAIEENTSRTLDTTGCVPIRNQGGMAIIPTDTEGHYEKFTVRRLTPIECLRLQGFPDNYLDVKHKGNPAADSQKYRVIGNSMAVPVVKWIGKRINKVTKAIN